MKRMATMITVMMLTLALGTGAALALDGTSSADKLMGTAQADTIRGKAGADRIFGKGNDDKLYGGRGRDVLKGGRDSDGLFGGRGKDLIMARDHGLDNVECGRGVDTVQADAEDVISSNCENVDQTAGKARGKAKDK